jgi:small subunit ribosomal protein S18
MSDLVKSPSLDDVFDERKVTETTSPTTTMKKKGKFRKRKPLLNLKCPLCETGVKKVTYKDVYQLKKFTSVRGKIIHPEKSGVCRTHQRQVSNAIKRARYIALLPYVFIEG